MSKTTKIGICTVLLCMVAGFWWSDILNVLSKTYSFKCHDVWRRWVGKTITEISEELGPPAAKEPTDEEIKRGTVRDVPYQVWIYKKPELTFYVRRSDNTVMNAYGDFKFQIIDSLRSVLSFADEQQKALKAAANH